MSELYELLDKQTREAAKTNLLAFAGYTRPHYRPNWHHRRLCELLDRFAQGEAKRVMVCMPPRHGKSELVSRCLPAYLLGRDPDASIIATSYSAQLAARMNRDVQRIMDSKEYQSVFPETKLNAKNVATAAHGGPLRNSSLFEVVGHLGGYQCAGVGGGITGMGADFAIIDDPIKNKEDANSEIYRDKVWEWYVSTFYTRLEGVDASILITLTRWHEDDLGGRLLKLAREDPTADQWDVFSVPAIREPFDDDPRDPREVGEALWPDKFPLELLEKNKALGSYVWNALFQQRPKPVGGGIVKEVWFKRYTVLPNDLTDWLMSWDMTFKETKKGSFVCCQVWASRGTDRYLIDQHHERMDIVKTISVFVKMSKKYPQCIAKLVEDKANGPAIMRLLRGKISGIIAVSVKGSKEARLHSVAPTIEAGDVYIPEGAMGDALIEEVGTFPNSAFNDQVDTLSQALDRYTGTTPPAIDLDLSFGLSTPPPWRQSNV